MEEDLVGGWRRGKKDRRGWGGKVLRGGFWCGRCGGGWEGGFYFLLCFLFFDEKRINLDLLNKPKNTIKPS